MQIYFFAVAFCFAQRLRCASATAFRPAALIVLFLGAGSAAGESALRGRPLRFAEAVPARTERADCSRAISASMVERMSCVFIQAKLTTNPELLHYPKGVRGSARYRNNPVWTPVRSGRHNNLRDKWGLNERAKLLTKLFRALTIFDSRSSSGKLRKPERSSQFTTPSLISMRLECYVNGFSFLKPAATHPSVRIRSKTR